MASSNTISLVFIISTIIGFIDCVGIKFGSEIQRGQWKSTHETSFPLTIRGKHYFFGIDGNSTVKFWFISELGKDGRLVLEIKRDRWHDGYNRVFPFTIDHKQFIFYIRDQDRWFIQEILPGGLMGKETGYGRWESPLPTIIFPFHIGGKHHVFSLTGTDWFIKELFPNCTMSSKTDSGSLKFKCILGFPFWMNGRQYFYCREVNHWFIRKLLYGGKMSKDETAREHWTTNHRLYVPFSIDHEHYFYAAINGSKTSWFVQELLPGGKMGTEKAQGLWQDDFDSSFTLSIEGRQFFYRVSKYSWIVQEIIQEPRLPIIDLAMSRKNHCDVKKVSRRKRQNTGICDPQCQTININDSISAIEAYFSSIEDDVNDGYNVLRFSSQIDPVTLVATFRVPADAYHSSTADLTALIRAEIHRRHMPQQTDSIPPEIYEYLRQMDRANEDEAGQLLASSLGGINLPFNFAPQSPTLNGTTRISGSTIPQPGWYAVEKMLHDYLIEMPGDAYVRWALAPIYSLLPNTNLRRPTNFLLTVRFYNAQNDSVNWRGKGAHLYFNFLNAPTEACKNASNHPWWDWSKPI